ncbi:MAG: DUF3492 domain-containing protein [Balneolaceae bacterium]|nr:DUF3492 domain-containing protein [Balneolaceae bacterium]
MQTKPTILLVIEGTYPWYRGGVSEWVHQYIKAFDHVQFSILQIATDEYRNNSLETAVYELPDHIASFTRIPPPEMNSSWEIASEAWFSSQHHHIKAPSEQADVIHVANTGFAGWLGMKLASKYGQSLVLTEHALYWQEVKMGAVALECGYKIPQHEQGKTDISDLFKNIARQVYQASDQIISVSECNISKQKEMGAESVKYIPNGVDKTWIKQDKLLNERLVVGWIGRCAEMKNPLKFFDSGRGAGPIRKLSDDAV